jgi:uncharacterized protein (TIGR02118 family)
VLVVLGFLKRKPGLTLEEFNRYWRDVHGPLVRGTPEVARHFVKYVQHQLTPGKSSPGAPELPYDAFSETWYETAEDRERMRAEPKFKEVIAPDEANFLDPVRLAMIDTQVVQIGPGDSR